jgi:hypothetical protein
MARRAAQRAQDETLVDEHEDEGQSSRTGVITEDEHALELSRSVAKRMGWTPREDWKRDPAKWVDAPDFLEQTPRELESLKERLKRTGQAAEAAMAEAQRQAQADAEARVRAAVEAKDPDEALRASRDLARTSGPPPQTVAWMGRNPWFQTDQDAQVLAVAEINRRAAMGASIEDQLEAAEQKVRLRFPEHFDPPSSFGLRRDESAEGGGQREVRLSERAAPVVQSGSRGGNATPKVKGFADIHAGDRALYQKHFAARFENSIRAKDKKLTAEQVQEQARGLYAATYWREKEE